MNIGTVMRKRRAELGFKQRHVAQQLEISEDYLSMLERELRTPAMDLLERWAKVLKVPVSYVLLEAEPINPGMSAQNQVIFEDIRKMAAELLLKIDELHRTQ